MKKLIVTFSICAAIFCLLIGCGKVQTGAPGSEGGVNNNAVNSNGDAEIDSGNTRFEDYSTAADDTDLDSAMTTDNESIIVSHLQPELITGKLPTEIASVNGDWSTYPCLVVGRFESESDPVFYTQIAPTLGTSGFGSLVSSSALPSANTNSTPMSGLYGIAYSVKDQTSTEITGIISLEDAIDSSINKDGIVINQTWDGENTAAYVYPLAACLNDGIYFFKSLMDGTVFFPEIELPEGIKNIAINETELGDSIDVAHCGIAVFTIQARDADGSYTIHLENFLTLSPEQY